MSESPQSLVDKLFGRDGHPQGQPDAAGQPESDEGTPDANAPPKKRNFLQKLFGGGNKQPQPQQPPPSPPQ